MTMIERIFKNIWKSNSQKTMFTPKNVEATFELTYRKLEIGTLSGNRQAGTYQPEKRGGTVEAFRRADNC
jgi:hypothetical protein